MVQMTNEEPLDNFKILEGRKEAGMDASSKGSGEVTNVTEIRSWTYFKDVSSTYPRKSSDTCNNLKGERRNFRQLIYHLKFYNNIKAFPKLGV